MRSFLTNKNVSFYYWLKKKTGKKWALGIANATQKIILIFGRDKMPYSNRNEMLIEKQE